MGEKAANRHHPSAGQQQVLAGRKIKASHCLSVIFPHDHQRTLRLKEMCQDNLLHLFFFLEVDDELLRGVAVVEEMEGAEIEEETYHRLDGLVFIFLATAEHIWRDVGHAPVLKTPGSVLEQQLLI